MMAETGALKLPTADKFVDHQYLRAADIRLVPNPMELAMCCRIAAAKATGWY